MSFKMRKKTEPNSNMQVTLPQSGKSLDYEKCLL